MWRETASRSERLDESLSARDFPSSAVPASRRRPQRLSTAVADELLRRIVSGEYAVGAQLPPEPLLVDEFEVSRPVAREAVKSLEAAGLVSIRQGEGTVVRARQEWSILDQRVLRVALTYSAGSRLVDDAIDLRAELERSLVAEAAEKLTDGDFSRMVDHLRVMDSSTDLTELQRADLAFHQIYRERAGNELKSSIARLLVEEMPLAERIMRDPRAMYDFANKQHWEIYEALLDGRTDDAIDAIARHVRESWTWRPHEAN
ncbi:MULTISPECIES: GntR family transcriptional regulator [unclassified Leifsonia]|uniref:FadR/GntR family transcriptional regulator n=1 Tax=unclassified Leifsonia TaxID=2663824 RepID=UPI0008A772C4|nr:MULTISPECIES: GntR family transcriptional regulator [unclassified Leifsonia]SEH65461.1 DNA-binding transcriptional regulator, FadR family [Leifsonia sp. CL154]SFL27320.1 DNA-binding transcriptional regulator, FadR family [Leifsonia sp. CL147]